MRKMLSKVYSSWDSMKLTKAITVNDIPEIRTRMPIGTSIRLTTDVYTRGRKIRYTNWAIVVGNYPYHCLMEMYYDNGFETIFIRRDIPYVDLLVSLKNGSVPYAQVDDNMFDKEVSL